MTNNDLISRAAAIDAMSEAYEKDEIWEDYEKRLNELPSAQPEIIHCRDCKYWNPYRMECEGIGNWFGFEGAWEENGYCYKAERRADG